MCGIALVELFDVVVLRLSAADCDGIVPRFARGGCRSGEKRLLSQYRAGLTVLEAAVGRRQFWQWLSLHLLLVVSGNRQFRLRDCECTVDVCIVVVLHASLGYDDGICADR